MNFEWNEGLSVHVKEIDEQHKTFVGLINRLNDTLNSRKTGNDVKNILDELVAYAKLHFDTEEKYFKKFKYVDAKEHIDEHSKLLKKLRELHKSHSKDNIKVSFELIDFLEDWLINHLDTQDKKYVKCFNDHGLF
jgi:hemerythrin